MSMLYKSKQYKSRGMESLHKLALDLHAVGDLTDAGMDKFDEHCLLEPGTPRVARQTWQATVQLRTYSDASPADVRSYIDDAVASWVGSYAPPGARSEDDPGDPMWGLDEVVVGPVRVVRK